MQSSQRKTVEATRPNNSLVFTSKAPAAYALVSKLKIRLTILLLSAKKNVGVDELKNQLLSFVNTGALRNNETIVTNTRHYDSLLKALEEIQKVQYGLDTDLSSDLMAIDIKEALYHFGMITGQVTNDELLGNIFANFCIGK